MSGLIINPFRFDVGGGGGGPYVAQGVAFGGTLDWLTRGANLTGAVVGKQGLVSMWWRTSSIGEDRMISTTDSFFDVIMDNADLWEIEAERAGGLDNLFIKSTRTINNGIWHHGIASWDLADSAKVHLYLNDAEELNITTFVDIDINYPAGDIAIGASPGGGNKWAGDLADIWFNDTYLDLSVRANRRKFINTAGSPVDLGSDGSIPISAVPLMFFSGAIGVWEDNKGDGGGFTENGTIVVAATNPFEVHTSALVEDIATSINDDDVTAHTVALPPGILAGETIIVVFSLDQDSTVTFPGTVDVDWHIIFDATNTTNNRLVIAWRRADGTEGASIQVTSSAVQNSAHTAYRIINAADPDITPPEVSASATGSGTAPDPAIVTPTGGAKNYLYLAAVGTDGSNSATVAPTGYLELTAINATPGGAAGVSSAHKNVNAASENPGTFTLPFGEQWVAATVAVHPFETNGVTFDGLNDWLSKATDLAGNANSKLLTVSMWFKRGAIANDERVYDGNPRNNKIRFTTDNRWNIQFVDSLDAIIVDLDSTTAITDTTRWHHVAASFDLSSDAKRHLFVDGISDLTVVVYDDLIMDLTTTAHAIGADTGAGRKIDSCIADLWIGFGQYLDLSIPANLQKFRTPGGKPVSLGSDGSRPTGTAPIMFFSGPTVDWHENKGGGGGFIENGALTDCDINP